MDKSATARKTDLTAEDRSNVEEDPVLRNRSASNTTGVVIIGRNEGDRLQRCLESVCGTCARVVYVDSGSQDDSVATSRAMGVSVAELDMSMPFTAARARNEGFRRLLAEQPDLEFVFFVDGDCEVVAGWMDTAARFLDQHPDVAVVCGRRREKYPEKSLYNMLIDIEWDVPVGETKYCGGDAVMRVSALQQVNGYRADLICGEEPELCVRLRQAGWRIWHLGNEMTRHDAALYRFGQWWKRMIRGGYAFAQGALLHGAPPERHWVREYRRSWAWGLFIPVAIMALTLAFGWWALLLLTIYPLQVLRLFLKGKRSMRQNWWQAVSLVVCQFAEMFGQMKFELDRLRRAQSRIIEYK
jgi:cellulose synthase/poly-beta-1,6-N-acetylglucosamine synthase-like glycosyltransferase